MPRKKLIEQCAENNGFGERLLREWIDIDVDGNAVDINRVDMGINIRMQTVYWFYTLI